MQSGREAGSGEEEEEEEESVFQSPEWDPSQGQGASPQLRRSARKRKSTAGGDEGMNKGNSSKKKKQSPNKMPKVTRSPPKPQTGQGQSFEALLLAMEGRITAKLDKASEAANEAAHQAKLNSEGLELLEQRVDANENCLMEALKMSEARIMSQVQSRIESIVQDQVKDMVDAQLHAAGFDQNLTAGDLSVRQSVVRNESETSASTAFPSSSLAIVPSTSSASYARVAGQSMARPSNQDTATKQEKQENKFLLARRSLRLWPIEGGRKDSLEAFLLDKLRLEASFIKEELGQVTLMKPKEPRNKNKEEYIVTFESKQIRDAVKANASHLANHRETAGMRLHVPDHLQRDFQALMNLSYDLKKRHPALKRNIKFDEDDCGLFMDIRLSEDKEWSRVKPQQAYAATKARRKKTRSLNEDDLKEMLGGESE